MIYALVTQEELRHLLNYDPESGTWIWVNPPNHNTRLRGMVAGNVDSDGYRKIRIRGRLYLSSRLAWLYMTGDWPKQEIDHIDRNPFNDEWANLREATSSQNKFNSVRQSGLRGVYPCGNKWQVQAGGVYLGLYKSLEDAIAARDAAALSMAGPFAVLNAPTERVT